MSLENCVSSLLANDVCVLPTETVYGLACSALSVDAIEKVYRIKGRPPTNPLIVHVLDHEQASDFCVTNKFSKLLANVFWPGPLTFILPKRKCIPHQLTAGLPNVGIRSPSHPLFRRVLKIVNIPLAAPSANPANKLSPTSPLDIVESFGKDCPEILDGGPCELGIESTVLDLTTSVPNILRPGPIGQASIEEVLGFPVNCTNGGKTTGSNSEIPKTSPGQEIKHYAPDTPLYLYSNIDVMINSKHLKIRHVMVLPHPKVLANISKQEQLSLYFSQTGNPRDIAKNLFSTLRRADKLNKEIIHTSLFPDNEELYSALNDRLSRAASVRI